MPKPPAAANASAMPEATPDIWLSLIGIADELNFADDLTQAVHMMATDLDKPERDAIQAVVRTAAQTLARAIRMLDELRAQECGECA